jgi:predicted RNase H-like HicB family nuclease
MLCRAKASRVSRVGLDAATDSVLSFFTGGVSFWSGVGAPEVHLREPKVTPPSLDAASRRGSIQALGGFSPRSLCPGCTLTGRPEGLTTFKVEIEREDDGRCLAELVELPGALAYGETQDMALSRVQALALRVIAERLEHGEARPDLLSISFNAV